MKSFKVLLINLIALLALSACSVTKLPEYTNATSKDGVLQVPLSSYILETEGTQIWYELSDWDESTPPEVSGALIIKDGKGIFYDFDSQALVKDQKNTLSSAGITFNELVAMDKGQQEKVMLDAYRKGLDRDLSFIKRDLQEYREEAFGEIEKYEEDLFALQRELEGQGLTDENKKDIQMKIEQTREYIKGVKESIDDAATKLESMKGKTAKDYASYQPKESSLMFEVLSDNGVTKEETLKLSSQLYLATNLDPIYKTDKDGINRFEGFKKLENQDVLPIAYGTISSQTVGNRKLVGLRISSGTYIGGLYTILDSDKIELALDSPGTKIDNFEVKTD